ncbi:hypothetical protein [Bdellovibrio sp. HCB2-146]|uniref:hypothetical protein n=1 Tax=Bdellovibrio sp. HCB2-146 TaxID=3394362 RepID=UPI0039BC45BC
MKTLNSKLMILLAAFSLIGVGCGSSNSFETLSDSGTGTVPDGGIIVAPDNGGNTGSGTYTNQAAFTPVSFTEFSNYVAVHALNNPSNYKVTVNLTQIEEKRYAGTVKISYTDAGQNYEATFSAGSGRNVKYYDLKDSGTLEANFNYWYVSGGKSVFSGYFQDAYGSIILIVDNAVNQGDGQGGGYVTGSIYYKNFAQSYATQSPYRKCWFIYNGPYDCRAGAVSNKSSLVPGDGYRKLGTFTGLSLSAAFK